MASSYYKPCPELDACNNLINQYYLQGDYATCFAGHLTLAEKGYPLAECQVGYFYAEGLGVPKDMEKSFYWTERAAQHGDQDAQYNLATLFYQPGVVVAQNLDAARHWLGLAAAQGHNCAQAELERLRREATGKALNLDNIILIGMPGCGKSTLGVVLAKALNRDFVDSDIVIQRRHGKRLSQILEEVGDDGFRQVENQANASLDVHHSVIATGGSVIYGQEAMEHLRQMGTIIYLKLSYPVIEDRLGDLHARGVTIKPGQTLRSLYDERCPEYERWADVIICCDGLRLREIVLHLRERLGLNEELKR